ncbi:BQ2448_4554 [Microbotryum intermedium]|uniref:BQ2448_4554 protein n=1 Tax=Microbotryum intermedium TaxID=269621 RepID=A0A238FDF1_9BASI|nr:BQ2448_4554 [Microbotryum intermedium]
MASLPSSSTILVYSLSSIPREQVDQIVQSTFAGIIRAGSSLSTLLTSATTPEESHLTSTASARGPRPWTIQNKYYTCDVQFVHFPQSQSRDVNNGMDDQEGYSVHGDEPAVIVVAPHTKTPSTDLATLLSKLGLREPEIDIALLLTSPPDSELSSDEVSQAPEDQAWDDLALDHGFEYVPSSSLYTSPALPGEGQDDGDGIHSGEKRGLERVVEALHAHIWEHMSPITRTRAHDQDERLDQGPRTPEHSSDLPNLPHSSLPKAREYRPVEVGWPESLLPNIAKVSTKSEEVEEQGKDLGFEDDFSDFISGPSKGGASETGDEIPSSSSTEDDLTLLPKTDTAGEGDDFATLDQQDQELEALFAQLSTAREQAMGMTDMDERRAFAEKTVLSLLG